MDPQPAYARNPPRGGAQPAAPVVRLFAAGGSAGGLCADAGSTRGGFVRQTPCTRPVDRGGTNQRCADGATAAGTGDSRCRTGTATGAVAAAGVGQRVLPPSARRMLPAGFAGAAAQG